MSSYNDRRGDYHKEKEREKERDREREKEREKEKGEKVRTSGFAKTCPLCDFVLALVAVVIYICSFY